VPDAIERLLCKNKTLGTVARLSDPQADTIHNPRRVEWRRNPARHSHNYNYNHKQQVTQPTLAQCRDVIDKA
jgi:hypothetical protein